MESSGTFTYYLRLTSNPVYKQSSSMTVTGKYEITGNLTSEVYIHFIATHNDGTQFSIWGKLYKMADHKYFFSRKDPMYDQRVDFSNPVVPEDIIYAY